jgi:hypothetical protein
MAATTHRRTSNKAAAAAYEHGRAAAKQHTIDPATLARLTRQYRTGVARRFLAGVNAELRDQTQQAAA